MEGIEIDNIGKLNKRNIKLKISTVWKTILKKRYQNLPTIHKLSQTQQSPAQS